MTAAAKRSGRTENLPPDDLAILATIAPRNPDWPPAEADRKGQGLRRQSGIRSTL